MKKLTKKQMIATGAIVILGVGGISAGVISHNNTVHAQQVAKTKAHEAKVKADKKAKAEQLAKEKEVAQQKQVAILLATATKNPSDASIKAVNDAIAKLTDQKEKTKDADLVRGLNNRLALIKKAQAAVKEYQAHATDANKQKAAQAAINALTDKNDASVKAQLQKLFDASNKQAQEAAKAAQAKQQTSQESQKPKVVDSSGQEVASTPQENNSNSSDNSTSSNVSPSYNGGGTSANTGTNTNSNGSNQGNSSSNNGNNNSNNNSNNNGNNNNNNGNNDNPTPDPNPQPTVKYMGWVSVDGVVKYSQNFDTAGEAQQYASAIYHGDEMLNLMFDGHSISWGVRPVQV
jgi:Alanyl-tRNA synthetase